MNNTILHEDLVFLDCEISDQLSLLNSFSDVLYKAGYVKDSYAEAIIERERKFPTGLNTPGIKIAMPHTYPVHVLKPAVLVATLRKPVLFSEMANSNSSVAVQLIFMLAITDPEGHLSILKRLISIFSDKKKLLDIYQTQEKKAIIEKLGKILF